MDEKILAYKNKLEEVYKKFLFEDVFYDYKVKKNSYHYVYEFAFL